MDLTFETLGNATVQFCAGSRPILATDPWLVGTCYFGSWALDHPLTPEQIRRVCESEYIWISHGHPDHLHHESLKLLPRGKTILIPDHFDRDIHDFLTGEGFKVEVLAYRTWRRLDSQLEILCLDNENQDAILVVRMGEALILNLNDSPLCGEAGFLRKLVREHPNNLIYALRLCSVDADMFNFVDASGQSILEAPEKYKPGAIWSVAREAKRLGAKYFCCSSSQHIYVRSDTVWANPYRISTKDIRLNWNQPDIKVVPPFVTMNVGNGKYIENHPSGESDVGAITDVTGDDDWNERLSASEWNQVETFLRRFEMLGRHIDFVEISVGGETRRFNTRPGVKSVGGDGVTFIAPRRSLLDAVAYGYFDDLLIGNFMKTRLHGRATLYPHITPIIAKLGGNAKVFTASQHRLFLWRYFRRNPSGFLLWRLEQWTWASLVPAIRELSKRIGVFDVLKRVYRGWILGDSKF